MVKNILDDLPIMVYEPNFYNCCAYMYSRHHLQKMWPHLNLVGMFFMPMIGLSHFPHLSYSSLISYSYFAGFEPNLFWFYYAGIIFYFTSNKILIQYLIWVKDYNAFNIKLSELLNIILYLIFFQISFSF